MLAAIALLRGFHPARPLLLPSAASAPITLHLRHGGVPSTAVAARSSLRRNHLSTAQPATETNPPTKLVTSPIFYVNAAPHIGHLYSIVLTDVIKRWFEFRGFPSMSSTGTDEHGLKIQEAAKQNEKEPKQFCDEVSKKFKDLFDKANIDYTDFIRTTEPRHHVAVQEMWRRLEQGGFIYKGTHEGWYCVSDETFYPATQVTKITDQNGKEKMLSKETEKPVEWTIEENYKFRLGDMKQHLIKWLEDNPDAIVPKSQYDNVMKALTTEASDGLTDLSVSRPRSRLQWGIPVPGDPNHVVYVWLDALTNYLTVTGFPWTENSDPHKRSAWPAQWHVVGKDIIKFHAIYWPAFLIAAGLPPPQRIVSHAHWLKNNTKMSKSLGNVADPIELMDKYGVDVVRYFLLRDGGIEYDAEFSTATVAKRQKELAGQLGNLVMRCGSGVVNPEGLIPATPGAGQFGIGEAEERLAGLLENLRDNVTGHFESIQFSRGIECVVEALYEANSYWNDRKPWDLAAEMAAAAPASPEAAAAAREQLRTALHMCLETVRIAALVLQPVMPGKMGSLLDALAVGKDERGWENAGFARREGTTQDERDRCIPGKLEPLFPMERVEAGGGSVAAKEPKAPKTEKKNKKVKKNKKESKGKKGDS